MEGTHLSVNDPLFDDLVFLDQLANARMPFGKYAGRLLIDLPEAYVVWFSRQGYPSGEIGEQLASLFVIKENGLESLLRPLVRSRQGQSFVEAGAIVTRVISS